MADINTTLNDIFRSTPLGDVKSAIGTVLYGINHRQTPNAVPINKDGYGLTFITRPQLNMSDFNLRALRNFIPLLTTTDDSLQRMVRMLLDPRLDLDCAFIDPKNAFIPILTNHMLSCSGWPDPYVEIHTSRPGVAKEVFSMVDSEIAIYSAYDISCTFRNMVGDPITLLMNTWNTYTSAVFKNIMVPYPDFIAYNEIDYNTRIYRLVLDKNKRFVQKIACTGASVPKSVPLGAAFNFEHDHPLNPSNDQLQIQFHCEGARYQDPIIVSDFNTVVTIFNPDMQADSSTGEVPGMRKLKPSELTMFNNRGYPRIDPDTMELMWYVSNDDYNEIMAPFIRNYKALTSKQYTSPTSINID